MRITRVIFGFVTDNVFVSSHTAYGARPRVDHTKSTGAWTLISTEEARLLAT
jgi:hypothetical protein